MEIVIIEINVGIKCIHVRIEYVECVGVKLGKEFLIFFIFDNTVIRAGIADSFGILQCNVWVEQEVYIQLSRFLVAAVLWNAYRVDEYICAFLPDCSHTCSESLLRNTERLQPHRFPSC